MKSIILNKTIFFLFIFLTNNFNLLGQSPDSLSIETIYRKIKTTPLYSHKRHLALDNLTHYVKTDAYLYQQVAMPLYKMKKYCLGKPYLDSAVKYDDSTFSYRKYRGFMECIFSKNYISAISDFKILIHTKYHKAFVMDHSFYFYLGLCYLQLNKFDSSEFYFNKNIELIFKNDIKNVYNSLDLFYMGVLYYEKEQYDLANKYFNETLKLYPKFSDVYYYQGIIFMRLKENSKAQEVLLKSLELSKLGKTINEDNEIYEKYPYQVDTRVIESILEYINQTSTKNPH